MAENRPQRTHLGDYSLTQDEAIQEAIRVKSLRFDQDERPNLEDVKTVILSEASRTTKIAKYWGIRNARTGQHKCYQLNLETLSQTKKNGWELKDDKSITLDEHAISKLLGFIHSVPQISTVGELLIIDAGNQENREQVSQILDWITNNEEAKETLAELASDKQSQSLAATLNHARLSKALGEFRKMVEDDDLIEQEFQDFLEENYWMFGSEYSAMLGERDLIWKGQLDFPMRRTADGYLEVIEIKTPHVDLFSHDGKRYIEKSEVWYAINQADDYLARVQDNFTALQNKYPDLGLRNLRGKVVIGKSRSHGEGERVALRRLNARLSRIEVITYDQLIAIAQRMLDILAQEGVSEPTSSIDDIPF